MFFAYCLERSHWPHKEVALIMPPLSCTGSWLLYFLIQVNYLTAFVFNLALGNPTTRNDNLITISYLAGEMRFRRIGPDSYTLSLRLVGGNHAYNLTVVLRTTSLESQKRPTSQAGTIEEYTPLTTSISLLLVHTPADIRLVPPGVPFQVPCPHCQTPLEIGEYCQKHSREGICYGCSLVPNITDLRFSFYFLSYLLS